MTSHVDTQPQPPLPDWLAWPALISGGLFVLGQLWRLLGWLLHRDVAARDAKIAEAKKEAKEAHRRISDEAERMSDLDTDVKVQKAQLDALIESVRARLSNMDEKIDGLRETVSTIGDKLDRFIERHVPGRNG